MNNILKYILIIISMNVYSQGNIGFFQVLNSVDRQQLLTFTKPVLIYLWGQSNGTSYNKKIDAYYVNKPELADTIEDAFRYNLQTNQFEALISGNITDIDNEIFHGVHAVHKIAYDLTKRYGIKVHICNYARGSTSIYDDGTINNWNVSGSGTLWKRYAQRIDSAHVKMDSIYGSGNWEKLIIIGMQGENDNFSPRFEEYKQNTIDLYRAMYDTIGEYVTTIHPFVVSNIWTNVYPEQVSLINTYSDTLQSFTTDHCERSTFAHYNIAGQNKIADSIMSIITEGYIQSVNIDTDTVKQKTAVTDFSGDIVYIGFNVKMNETITSTGFSLSGGKSITSIQRYSDDHHKYKITLDATYTNTDTITIIYNGLGDSKSYDNVSCQSWSDTIFNAIDVPWFTIKNTCTSEDNFKPIIATTDDGSLMIDYGDGNRSLANRPPNFNYQNPSDTNICIVNKGGMTAKENITGIYLVSLKIVDSLFFDEFYFNTVDIRGNSLAYIKMPDSVINAASGTSFNLSGNRFTTLDISAYDSINQPIFLSDNDSLKWIDNPVSNNVLNYYEARRCDLDSSDLSMLTKIKSLSMDDNSDMTTVYWPVLQEAMSNINLSGCALNQLSVDNCLQMLIDWYTTNPPASTLTIDLSGGTNAVPNSSLVSQLQTLFDNESQILNSNYNE